MSDRWVEVDVDWFGSRPWTSSARQFADRVRPLLAGDRELRGVMLNVGWLADVVTLFSGDLDQPLPLESRRYRSWRRHTYADLAALVDELRTALEDAGQPGCRIGLFTVGWGELDPPETEGIYDLSSAWRRRHPELYARRITVYPGCDLDPRVPLVGDGEPYAAFPRGIADGESFAAFFGAQWAALSAAVGLDALHLRDGWLGPMVYRRLGPYGSTASSDAEENRSWTDALRDVCRSIKDGSPDTTLLLYSSALGPTAEWMTGCVDLEAVLADGTVDVFVDQTWGGAWQDWWPMPALGWTFQSAFLALHGAVVRGADQQRETPCRHYGLIETWDGWEAWDTVHRTPDKLRWAIWSFAHTAVLTPSGPVVPDGMYVSWINGATGDLLPESDVGWVTGALDDAAASASRLERVLGPVLVHNREALERSGRDRPGEDVEAWLEDQAAMLTKFGLPVLGSTRAEWLRSVAVDGVVVPLATTTSRGPLRQLADDGHPVLLTGRAELVDPDVLRAAGAEVTGERRPGGERLIPPSQVGAGGHEVVHLPDHDLVRLVAGRTLLAEADGTPLVTQHDSSIFWQAPAPSSPADPAVDHVQLGSLTPYLVVAAEANRLASAAGLFAVAPRGEPESVSVQAWISGGRLHVLLGNLETGWTGDSRHPRAVRFFVPIALCPTGRLAAESGVVLDAERGDGWWFTTALEPEGMTLWRAVPAPPAAPDLTGPSH